MSCLQKNSFTLKKRVVFWLMTPTVPVITLQCEELKKNVVRKCQEEGFKNENWLHKYSLQWNLSNLTKPLSQAVSIRVYHQGEKPLSVKLHIDTLNSTPTKRCEKTQKNPILFEFFQSHWGATPQIEIYDPCPHEYLIHTQSSHVIFWLYLLKIQFFRVWNTLEESTRFAFILSKSRWIFSHLSIVSIF